jgi:hypothetical protein
MVKNNRRTKCRRVNGGGETWLERIQVSPFRSIPGALSHSGVLLAVTAKLSVQLAKGGRLARLLL